mmetsp:Transcript_17582/g.53610  ORF Transcript_17582/g.53610 Transcript_17582/m.53610 type:complete len:199 (+) Transcript_17582:91-687(+)
MQLTLIAATLAAAVAFAPAPLTKTKAAPLQAVEDLPGVVDAFPGFFDPLGLSEGKSEAQLKFWREAEIKHGRVAMLASVGFLVAEKFHPLFGGNIDAPSYLAFQQTPLQTFWPFVVTAIGWIEYSTSVVNFEAPGEALWTLKADYENGDVGFDPLGLKPTDADALKDMQTRELQNGRLAMLGIAGMVVQELITGNTLF